MIIQAEKLPMLPMLDSSSQNTGGNMFLQNKRDGNLIEVDDVTALLNPAESQVVGRSQSGEEEQDAVNYEKANLIFPSGEDLPRCWFDANYRVGQ
jgi:hypothetical protein